MNIKEQHLHEILSDENFEELAQFYLPYFVSDSSFIDFLYEILKHEPPHKLICLGGELHCVDSNNQILNDNVFIPKRMLNQVERFVTVARDMEIIRPGEDPFKIIFLITCIESLQSLRAITTKSATELKKWKKRDMLNDFFQSFTAQEDIEFITNHFSRYPDKDVDLWIPNERSLEIFIDALSKIRNAAVHTGDCWELLFPTKGGLIISVPNRLDSRKYTVYENEISYEKLEQIFVRTCIRFIRQYIHEMHP